MNPKLTRQASKRKKARRSNGMEARLLVGAALDAGVLVSEEVGGEGLFLGAKELCVGDCLLGLASLLLGTVQLSLELDNGGGSDALDGLVLLRHHRRLRQPSQRLHPLLPLLLFLLFPHLRFLALPTSLLAWNGRKKEGLEREKQQQASLARRDGEGVVLRLGSHREGPLGGESCY